MKKLIPFGYFASIVLVLSGVLYFFAANWPEFSRFEKLILAVAAMLLFYFLSIVSTKILSHQLFLGKWLLVAGAISFGLCVALIGQIYNSHADSYVLFVVWLIPALLLSISTRYGPFSILSFILFHLAYWFYMNPSSYNIIRTDFQEWLIYLVIAVINLILFIFTFSTSFQNKAVRYMSYIMTHIMLITMSIFELYEPYSGWTNLLYLGYAAISYFYLVTKKIDKYISIILFTMVSIYMCTKIIEIPFLFGDAIGFLGLQILGSIFSIALIVGGVILARHLSSKHSETQIGQTIKGTLIVIVTLIGSFMFSISFGGVLFLLFSSSYSTVVLSTIFIGVGLFVKKLGPYVRNTLLFIGFFSGLLEAFFLSTPITIFYLVISIVVIIAIKDGIIRFLSYSTFIGCSLYLLLDEFQLWEQLEMVLIGYAFVNALVYYFTRSESLLDRISLFYALLFFYVLTFVDHQLWQEIIYSLLFFIITTSLVLYFSRKEKIFFFRMTLLYWIALLVSTYYDLVWSLVHKSLSLLIIGLIFFGITQYYERKSEVKELENEKLFSKRQWRLIGIILLLQLTFVGYQIISNESLLKNGTEITLELAPVDPRSMLQGDYVILRYEIAEVNELNNVHSENRVYILAKKDEDGVYQREEILTSIEPTQYKLAEDEVLIAGKYNGYNAIILGIESFFVKEGTGLDLQRDAKYAKVKVAKNGNSLLESIY
ncbi:GDYXXLXY domain-containing protein [Bacillus sinesaloumensis]|uniref:GDYXXLXY domain-containing protein n=1 Tax=Litchfieldia sinesaloumensis TaxID=1926280 RepID=UPI00098861FC|nr:GDYXXLXY domain-containing protein [Bacillus sinesaloumensis]